MDRRFAPPLTRDTVSLCCQKCLTSGQNKQIILTKWRLRPNLSEYGQIMLSVDHLEPAISDLCRRLKVKRLDIFGSATTGSFRPDSDVDVLVEFERDVRDLFDRYFELKEGLEQILGRAVDVVVERAIKNPFFKASIEHTRKNIYAA